MKARFKRIPALLLCLAMVLAFFAVMPNSLTAVQAEEEEEIVNLFPYGDFEGSQTIPGWTIGATDKVTLEYRAGKTGKAALRIDDTSETDAVLIAGQKVDIVAGTRYTAAVQVKGAKGALVSLKFYNAAGEVVGSAEKESTAKFSSWVRISCNAVAPSDAVKAEASVGTTAACNSAVYFDDVTLTSQSAQTVNLVANPSFDELATIDNWKTTGAGDKTAFITAGMTQNGDGAIYVFDNSNSPVDIKSEWVPIRSNMIGQFLDFSYWIYGIGEKQSNSMTKVAPAVFIQFVDANGKNMDASTRIIQTGAYYERWTQRVTAGVIPQGAAYFYIWISFGSTTIGEGLVDNIVVSVRCDHNSLTYTEISKTSCDKPGKETAFCPLCEKNVERDIPQLSHDYDAGVITVKPECEETGKIQYTCKNCNNPVIEDIPVAGHDLVHVPATATNIEYWTCACGKWFEDAEGEYEIQIKSSVNIGGGTSSTNPTTPSVPTPTVPSTSAPTTPSTTPSTPETSTPGTQGTPTTPSGGQPGDTSDKTPILFFVLLMVVALAAFVFTKQIRRKG